MTNKEDVVIIGITGGIGSGKSTIAEWIRQKGFVVISSDEIAKKIMVENSKLKQKIIDIFGKEVYQNNGELNRKLLSDKIFNSDNPQVSKVNSIVHPFAIDYIVAELDRLADAGHKLIFVESALMFESGMADGYDYVVTVFTDEEKAIERVMSRSQISSEKIGLIIQSQLNINEKKKMADFVIDNNGNLEQLKQSFETLFSILVELPTN